MPGTQLGAAWDLLGTPAWHLLGSCLETCLGPAWDLPGTCLGLAWDLDNNRFSSELRAMMRVRVRVTVQRQRLSQ